MLDNCPVVDTFYQNGYILHASLPNYGERCRPALTMHFCSMNTLLTWHGVRTTQTLLGSMQKRLTAVLTVLGSTQPRL